MTVGYVRTCINTCIISMKYKLHWRLVWLFKTVFGGRIDKHTRKLKRQ